MDDPRPWRQEEETDVTVAPDRHNGPGGLMAAALLFCVVFMLVSLVVERLMCSIDSTEDRVSERAAQMLEADPSLKVDDAIRAAREEVYRENFIKRHTER